MDGAPPRPAAGQQPLPGPHEAPQQLAIGSAPADRQAAFPVAFQRLPFPAEEEAQPTAAAGAGGPGQEPPSQGQPRPRRLPPGFPGRGEERTRERGEPLEPLAPQQQGLQHKQQQLQAHAAGISRASSGSASEEGAPPYAAPGLWPASAGSSADSDSSALTALPGAWAGISMSQGLLGRPSPPRHSAPTYYSPQRAEPDQAADEPDAGLDAVLGLLMRARPQPHQGAPLHLPPAPLLQQWGVPRPEQQAPPGLPQVQPHPALRYVQQAPDSARSSDESTEEYEAATSDEEEAGSRAAARQTPRLSAQEGAWQQLPAAAPWQARPAHNSAPQQQRHLQQQPPPRPVSQGERHLITPTLPLLPDPGQAAMLQLLPAICSGHTQKRRGGKLTGAAVQVLIWRLCVLQATGACRRQPRRWRRAPGRSRSPGPPCRRRRRRRAPSPRARSCTARPGSGPSPGRGRARQSPRSPTRRPSPTPGPSRWGPALCGARAVHGLEERAFLNRTPQGPL